MRPLIAAFALMLTGCWTGESLYRPADAGIAMPPGLYRAQEEGRESRLTVLPYGRLQLNQGDYLGFAPLDREGRAFAVWSSGAWGDADDGEDMGIYGLLQRQADGDYLLFVPICSETEQIARAAGAALGEGAGGMACRFPNRASLESALRQLHPDPREARVRLTPIAGSER